MDILTTMLNRNFMDLNTDPAINKLNHRIRDLLKFLSNFFLNRKVIVMIVSTISR